MTQDFVIHDETPQDVDVIAAVTAAAFESLQVSRHTEHFVVDALRAAEALAVSLVAEAGGRVVGHIAFSPVVIAGRGSGWYGLGPVSVLPAYQGRGIGGALIREGLARLRKLGASGCCLVGHPEYYGRFGFRNVSGLVYPGAPAEVFFALAFDGRLPQGTVAFHDGFNATGPQSRAAVVPGGTADPH